MFYLLLPFLLLKISILSLKLLILASLRSLLFKSSHFFDTKILMFLVVLLILFSKILVNSAILVYSILNEKYYKIL